MEIHETDVEVVRKRNAIVEKKKNRVEKIESIQFEVVIVFFNRSP